MFLCRIKVTLEVISLEKITIKDKYEIKDTYILMNSIVLFATLWNPKTKKTLLSVNLEIHEIIEEIKGFPLYLTRSILSLVGNL